MGVDSNTGPCVYIASFITTEPSPQPLPCSLRQGLSLGSNWSDWLKSQGSSYPLPPLWEHHWDYKQVLPCSTSCMSAGDLNSGPHACMVLGARVIQGFLRGPDERTKGMLVLCFCPETGLARSGLGPGPGRSQGFCAWGSWLSPLKGCGCQSQGSWA